MHLGGRILCSLTSAKRVYRVVPIEAGRSLNGRGYAGPMLARRTEQLFNDRVCNAFEKVDADGRTSFDHVRPDVLVGKTLLNQVGFFRNARWSEAGQRVEAELHLLDTPEADRVDRHLRALEAAGGLDTVGLSIDGEGPIDPAGNVELTAIHSIDIVTAPSAGGRILHRIAASRGFGGSPVKTLLVLLAASHPRLVEGYKGPETNDFGIARHIAARAKADPAAASDLATAIGGTGEAKRFTEAADPLAVLDEVMAFCASLKEKHAKDVQEAEAARAAEAQRRRESAAGGSATTPEDRERLDRLERLLAESRVTESRRELELECDMAKLPAGSKAALVAQVGNRVLESGEAKRLVEATRKVLDDAIFAASGGEVTIVRESRDRQRDLLAHAFNPTQVPAPKEGVPAYIGDGTVLFEKHVFGGVRMTEALYGGEAGRRRLRESIDSTTSVKTLQDAMNIALLAAYGSNELYRQWEKIVRKVSLSTFRTHNVVKVPYYGNLPVVEKGAPYTAFTTPTETQEQITLVKYGGIESITLEDMINGDFLDLWQQRLQRLGQAAMETRSEVVHALHRDATMPTLTADSKTLTDSTRSPANEGTAALLGDATGVANFWASVAAMMASTGGSGVAKGLLPRYVVIPRAKMAAWAYVAQSFAGGMSGVNVPEGLQKILKLAVPEAIIDVRTSSTTDWYLLADPAVAEVIRVGELAGRGGPRIDIADDLTFGAMFVNDKLEAKISDVFAAAAVDFAGIYGNDAAS